MRILVANDDGYEAEGVIALAEALDDLAEVWVVAPEQQQSAKSHALTLLHPLRARRRGPRRFSVDGTPADCVYLGLHGLLDEAPDLVLSGINLGSNLGSDVHYSGTVAAAREACLGGIPAIAISLHVGFDAPHRHWDTACHVARHLVQSVGVDGLPPRTLLNVNVPNVAPASLAGIRTARLGARTYETRVTRRQDPWGRPYYWIGGAHQAFDEDPAADGPLVEAGYAAVTPLHSDPTLHDFLDVLSGRIDT